MGVTGKALNIPELVMLSLYSNWKVFQGNIYIYMANIYIWQKRRNVKKMTLNSPFHGAQSPCEMVAESISDSVSENQVDLLEIEKQHTHTQKKGL